MKLLNALYIITSDINASTLYSMRIELNPDRIPVSERIGPVGQKRSIRRLSPPHKKEICTHE